MTNEQFKELDLRKQLTDELKTKWYYKQYKSKLRILKHKVVFDRDFIFNLKYFEPEYAKETKDFIFEGVKYHTEKGELLCTGFVRIVDEDDNTYALPDEDNFFDNEDKYLPNPKEILENILLYICNCI